MEKDLLLKTQKEGTKKFQPSWEMLKNKANLLLGISVGIESNSVSIDSILNWCSIRLSWCWTCNQCHVICDLLQNLCDPTSSAIYFYLYVNINKPTSPLWSILISSTIPLFFSLWTYGNNPLRSTLIQNLSTRLKSSGKWEVGRTDFPMNSSHLVLALWQ